MGRVMARVVDHNRIEGGDLSDYSARCSHYVVWNFRMINEDRREKRHVRTREGMAECEGIWVLTRMLFEVHEADSIDGVQHKV